MKSSIKKILILEVIMLLVIITTFFSPFLFDNYKYLIFLLVSGFVSVFLVGFDTIRSPRSKEILKTIIIYLLFYFLLAYMAGLFVGFARTIYSWTSVNLIKNILPAVTVLLVSEFMRYQLVKKSNHNKICVILAFLIFTLLDISIGFNNYDLSIKGELYEFIGLISIGSIAKNVLMLIFCIKGDYVDSIAYRLVMDVYVYLVPIVPNFGIYLDSVIMVLLPALLGLIVLTKRMRKVEKPNAKKKSSIVFFTVTGILLVLVLLNSGFIKYQTVVIGSNSMLPVIRKGDVVMMSKLNDNEYKKLEVGEILVFRHEGKLICHRIHEILKKNDQIYYITKGDANKQVDAVIIDKTKAVGVVKFTIKYVGLPSVWLSEAF